MATKTIEQWIDELQASIKTAEEDVVGDMGPEIWESGGGSEVIRNVVMMSEAPDAAKREVLRMEGIPWR